VELASLRSAWKVLKKDHDELVAKLIEMGCLGPIARYFTKMLANMTDEQKHDFVRRWNQT
jgi:hypothetical protein